MKLIFCRLYNTWQKEYNGFLLRSFLGVIWPVGNLLQSCRGMSFCRDCLLRLNFYVFIKPPLLWNCSRQRKSIEWNAVWHICLELNIFQERTFFRADWWRGFSGSLWLLYWIAYRLFYLVLFLSRLVLLNCYSVHPAGTHPYSCFQVLRCREKFPLLCSVD